jgi:hypothetical protein
MEISDDFSIQNASLELGEESSKISFQRSPKGLSAISDSIDMCPLKGAPKPNSILRIGYSMALKVFQIMTLGIELWAWVFERIFGGLSQRSLYEKLYEISLKGNVHEIQNFLKKHSQNSSAVSYLFSEFQNLPRIVAHLPEILKGANVCLEGDRGFFYSRWKSHAESYPRVSSHCYQPNTCFAIDHVLFWLDLEGNTRFQFENSPLNSLLSSMRHFADYLRYKRDNEQQGVTGTSAFTEEHPLRLRG